VGFSKKQKINACALHSATKTEILRKPLKTYFEIRRFDFQ